MGGGKGISRRPLLALTAIFAALALAPAARGAATQARPADAVVESIGVNTHLGYTDTPYDDFAMVDALPGRSLVRITLHEGRKRIVRRLMAEVGFPVEALVRTDLGEVSLGEQRPGTLRALTRKEVGALYKAVGL